MTSGVRCKFQCHEKTGVPDANAEFGRCNVRFGAVWEGTTEKQQASENAIFGKWTPSGEIKLCLANPDASEFFKEGKKYYVTFTEASD